MSLSRVIDNHIKVFEAGSWTSIPAKIINIPEGDITKVTVRPVLRKLLRGAESLEYPEVREVPIVFPGSSSGLLRVPLKVGDYVLVVFSARPLQNWLNGDGSTVEPESFQKLDYNSAIAIPGIFPFKHHAGKSENQSLADSYTDTVLKSNINTGNENEVRLKEDGSVEITGKGSASKITMSASGEITITGNLTVNGTVTATGDIHTSGGDISTLLNTLDTHVHNYTDTSGGLGTVPTTAPVPAP